MAPKQLESDTAYIPFIVLQELENIKSNQTKDENVKIAARRLIKTLISDMAYGVVRILNEKEKKEIRKICQKAGLEMTNDNLIICEAELTRRKGVNIQFQTSDGMQYIICHTRFPALAVNFVNGQRKEELWTGYKHLKTTEESAAEIIRQDPTTNYAELDVNEYAIIGNVEHPIAIFQWDGKKNREIFSIKTKSLLLGEAKPRNTEQILAMDLLANNNIKVKVLLGTRGSGKDFLMFSQAIELVERHKFEKIVYCRNLITLGDTPQIGFLAGSLEDKIMWGIGPIQDKAGGEDAIRNLIDSRQLELCHLSFIRGRSWDNCIIYVSEGQNLTKSQICLLLSRCGENTQLWINADQQQIDDKVFSKDNGIEKMVTKLKNNPLFGCVYLPKTERSATAELANCLDA